MERHDQERQNSLYQEELARLIGRGSIRPKDKSPDEVSIAVMHAMFDENPKRRHMVVPNDNLVKITDEKPIDERV